MTVNDDILRYIKDADFIRFVFEGTPSQLNYWRGYIARRPEEKDAVLRSKYLLLHLDEMKCHFSDADIDTLKKCIQTSLSD